MIRKIDGKEFDKQLNDLILDGWQVDNIEEVRYFNVKLSKNSGMLIYKDDSKIPLLSILNMEMIVKICQGLNLSYSQKDKEELINELEQRFTKGVINTAYERIIDNK
jgi:hypothetical protein